MIRYELNAPVEEDALNALFQAAWPRYETTDFHQLLDASLLHVMAFDDLALVGFVRIVRSGLTRGFVLGPTVHPDHQRQGVGTGLLNEAASAAKEAGVTSLHVEFPPGLRGFYGRAGFQHSAAGVRRL